jgi:hypothetical protein
VAQELLGAARFLSLQLEAWLGTTDGEVRTQAIEAVPPMFYAEDVALLVAGFKLATATQQQEGASEGSDRRLGHFVIACNGYLGYRGNAA